MNSISNRAKNLGWHNILSTSDSNRTTRNLINKYCQLTTEEVKSHAQANWTNQPSRDAQNSEMMYHLLFKSLGDSFKSTVLLKNSNYMTMVGNYTTEDGPCPLKKIIISTLLIQEPQQHRYSNLWGTWLNNLKNKRETSQNSMNG